MEQEQYLSVHILKTAGSTMRRVLTETFDEDMVYFYYPNLYPNSGFMRADVDPQRIARKQYVETLKAVLFRTAVGRRLYALLRKVMQQRIRQAEETTRAPDSFAVIHGHFRADELTIPETSLITVFREPLARAYSHYQHLLRSAATFDTIPEWFEPTMPFVEFMRCPAILNVQSQFLGEKSLDDFAIVGVVEDLSRYCRQLGYTGELPLPRINVSPAYEMDLPDYVRAEFEKIHEEDYALYSEALQRIALE